MEMVRNRVSKIFM